MRKPNTAKAAEARDLRQRAAQARDAAGRLRTGGTHPDAALFALGEQFMAAWVAEEANGDEPEYRACSRIARKIVHTPAVTVAGYGIKALLLARLDSDASGPHAPIEPHGPADSWWNVLRQVQQGAARLVNVRDVGMPMSAASNREIPGLPVTEPVPPRSCAPFKPELSGFSVEQLARLYPVLVRASEVLSSAESAPCFWYADQTRTDAGCIINWETDRMHRLASEVVLEIRRRQPVGDDEAEERANTLLSHMVLTGGVAEHPELIAEINATWGA
ncbi:hypothetical protein M6G65_13365 [Methylobacterium tardum]|uniref:hypothetical protein n=1 Tax=Methylobacterium tardum TaxID=374432 RepID=UPI0020221575|nr:hypothetical protein [Methylobacterium tardum]URD39304.1 hypothetical protein M6G65_13365 [Methylobacterium tardum]